MSHVIKHILSHKIAYIIGVIVAAVIGIALFQGSAPNFYADSALTGNVAGVAKDADGNTIVSFVNDSDVKITYGSKATFAANVPAGSTADAWLVAGERQRARQIGQKQSEDGGVVVFTAVPEKVEKNIPYKLGVRVTLEDGTTHLALSETTTTFVDLEDATVFGAIESGPGSESITFTQPSESVVLDGGETLTISFTAEDKDKDFTTYLTNVTGDASRDVRVASEVKSGDVVTAVVKAFPTNTVYNVVAVASDGTQVVAPITVTVTTQANDQASQPDLNKVDSSDTGSSTENTSTGGDGDDLIHFGKEATFTNTDGNSFTAKVGDVFTFTAPATLTQPVTITLQNQNDASQAPFTVAQNVTSVATWSVPAAFTGEEASYQIVITDTTGATLEGVNLTITLTNQEDSDTNVTSETEAAEESKLAFVAPNSPITVGVNEAFKLNVSSSVSEEELMVYGLDSSGNRVILTEKLTQGESAAVTFEKEDVYKLVAIGTGSEITSEFTVTVVAKDSATESADPNDPATGTLPEANPEGNPTGEPGTPPNTNEPDPTGASAGEDPTTGIPATATDPNDPSSVPGAPDSSTTEEASDPAMGEVAGEQPVAGDEDSDGLVDLLTE